MTANASEGQGSYYLDYLQDGLGFPQSVYHGAKYRIVRRFVRSFPVGSAILDAGCGCGFVTAPFTRDYRVYGIDSEAEAIRFCQENHRGVYAVESAYGLSFDDGMFDGVVMNDAIEHLEDPRAVLRELHRVIRPGGKIEVCTVNYDSYLWLFLENTWYRVFGGNCRPFDRAVHPSRFTAKSLRDRMAEFFAIEAFVLRNFGMEMFCIGRKGGT